MNLAPLLMMAVLACAPAPPAGVNHCYGFTIVAVDEAAPVDSDASLLNELNERFDDACVFDSAVITCFAGATSDKDCQVLADEARAIASTPQRPVDAQCLFTCEIE